MLHFYHDNCPRGLPVESEKNSILIVDDETTNIAALFHVLSTEYTIYIEIDGANCLDIAKALKPDIILLDVMMPNISGFDVIKLLKEDVETCNIPVVFQTALDTDEDKVQGLELGAVGYIQKPFQEDIIKLQIKNLMEIINFAKIYKTGL